MQDHEVIAIALFKLNEAAKRIAALANSASCAEIRTELHTVATRIGEQEQRLRTLAARMDDKASLSVAPQRRAAS